MKSSVDILDAVGEKLGGATDYRIAKVTGIPAATVSSIRAHRCQLSRANCKRAALVLGVEAGALIAIVAAEREEDEEIRDSLFRVAGRAIAAVAVAGLLVGGSATYAPTAAAGSASCVLCKIRRRSVKRAWRVPHRRRTAPVANICNAEASAGLAS